MPTNWLSADAPVVRRVRAYFAPVDRATQTPTAFNAASQGRFDLDAPPTPWVDLGWIQGFTRKAASKTVPIMTGVPAAALGQVRESLDAQVRFQFLSWTKLTMALATGSQHMNILACTTSAQPDESGVAVAVSIMPGSTASSILLGAQDTATFAAGSIVAVDQDYTGQTGFVGSPISGAYLRNPLTDMDYIRRVTFNIALVSQVTPSGLVLAEPLPGGVPAAGNKVQAVTGFVDREGGTFFQEWSALFVIEGSQGERVFFYYPRLQPMGSTEEAAIPLSGKDRGGLERVVLEGKFLAFPVVDALDGERVACYRSFVPAVNASV